MMVFRENSWFWKISKGQEKFLTLDFRFKFQTQWLGPECQMGRALVVKVQKVCTDLRSWLILWEMKWLNLLRFPSES